MHLFETVCCDLCGSRHHEIIYKTDQYADSSLGKLEINLVSCDKCGFIFQNPQLSNEALQRHYQNSSSGNVYRLNSKGSIHSIFHGEVKKMISEFISTQQIKSICDVGGGRGQILSEIEVKSTVKKYLIEPSDAIYKCTDECIMKIKESIENITPKDISNIDFLMCTATLEHLKNPNAVLRKLNTLIADDGHLFLEVPNSLRPYSTFAEFYSYEHINHFTIKTILQFLTKTGFSAVRIEESKYHPSIKIIAQKDDLKNHVKLCKQVFQRYRKEKELLSKELENKLAINISKDNVFAIYGAGDHTRFIIEKTHLIEHVKYFIDSDPDKWGKFFYGIKIISPTEINPLNISDILISSHDFEKEIFATIKRHTDKNINIIRLYASDDEI